MSIHPLFAELSLSNRLGQQVSVHACRLTHQGRDFIILAAPGQAPTFIGKNAETFAFQLREYWNLDARRFDLVEWRISATEDQWLRWRFEWVGHSPLVIGAESLSPAQRSLLVNLLNPVAAAAGA